MEERVKMYHCRPSPIDHCLWFQGVLYKKFNVRLTDYEICDWLVVSDVEKGSGGVETRPLSSLISFVSWMETQWLMKGFVYGELAGEWFTNTFPPGMHSGAWSELSKDPALSTSFCCRVSSFVGPTKPGHLHSSLMELDNPTSRRPREEAVFQLPTGYPERLLNNSPSQFFPKIPTLF